MADRLERFINLIAKTGDKLLVYDRHEPDESFVVLSLAEYERMTAEAENVKGLTEDQLIDKINRDITLWKGQQTVTLAPEAPTPETEVPTALNWQPPKASGFKPQPKGNAWNIPESRRHIAEEGGSPINNIL